MPAYLGIFVWAPFFDSLWIGDLTRFGLGWLIGRAVVGALLCYGLLFFIPASLGLRWRRPTGIVAASTFGTVGSEWITGVAVGVANIVWYAVAIDYAVDSTLLGLQSCGLIDPRQLQRMGPWSDRSQEPGLSVHGPLLDLHHGDGRPVAAARSGRGS